MVPSEVGHPSPVGAVRPCRAVGGRCCARREAVRWVRHRQRAARGTPLRRWSCWRCVPRDQRAARGTSLSRWVPVPREMGWVVGPAHCPGVPPGGRPDWASTAGASVQAHLHTYARSVCAVAYRAKPSYSLSLYRYIYQIQNAPSGVSTKGMHVCSCGLEKTVSTPLDDDL